MRNFSFIIAFQNFATLENRVTYRYRSYWPVVITMKEKLAGTSNKIQDMAGPDEWQQACNRSNPGKSGTSSQGTDFSW